MTYSIFLVIFLLIPIAFLARVLRRRLTRERVLMIGVLVGIALVYTTPWDNYLVANRIWYYDPARVIGITLGWVPLEEYTFFVLLPILAGLWLFLVAHSLPPLPSEAPDRPALRWLAALGGGAIWLAAMAVLLSGWQPGRYLSLILAWALPPILLQLAFGADLLWHHRRRVLLALIPAVLYFSAADSLAIGWGVWTISPDYSLPFFLGGVLPVEEFIFFLVVCALAVFGLNLALLPEGWRRAASMRARFSTLRRTQSGPQDGMAA